MKITQKNLRRIIQSEARRVRGPRSTMSANSAIATDLADQIANYIDEHSQDIVWEIIETADPDTVAAYTRHDDIEHWADMIAKEACNSLKDDVANLASHILSELMSDKEDAEEDREEENVPWRPSGT